MKSYIILLCSLVLFFFSCRKDDAVHPYYPHTVKLVSRKVTYNAWVKGIDKTRLLPSELFFNGDLFDDHGWQTITFLNDSLFYTNDIPSYYTQEEIISSARHYLIRGDSIYEKRMFSSMSQGMVPTIENRFKYINSLIAIGNRNELIDYHCYYTIGITSYPLERYGIYSPGLLNWNIFVTQGSLFIPVPDPNADTLAVVNCTYKYH